MTVITEPTAFQLSRFYSRGRVAAKKLLAAGSGEISESDAAALVPFPCKVASDRWIAGFMDALASKARPFSEPGSRSW